MFTFWRALLRLSSLCLILIPDLRKARKEDVLANMRHRMLARTEQMETS